MMHFADLNAIISALELKIWDNGTVPKIQTDYFLKDMIKVIL
jgi:hypothetical protein